MSFTFKVRESLKNQISGTSPHGPEGQHFRERNRERREALWSPAAGWQSSGEAGVLRAMSAGNNTPSRLRLLPIPAGEGPRISVAALQEQEGSGVGITLSLPERGSADEGPVVTSVFPGSAADVDGTIQVGAQGRVFRETRRFSFVRARFALRRGRWRAGGMQGG